MTNKEITSNKEVIEYKDNFGRPLKIHYLLKEFILEEGEKLVIKLRESYPSATIDFITNEVDDKLVATVMMADQVINIDESLLTQNHFNSLVEDYGFHVTTFGHSLNYMIVFEPNLTIMFLKNSDKYGY